MIQKTQEFLEHMKNIMAKNGHIENQKKYLKIIEKYIISY